MGCKPWQLDCLAREAAKSIADQLHAASVNISNTTQDAVKSIVDAKNKAGDAIGDKLGGGVAVHGVNKVNPAMLAIRGAVNSLIAENVVGFAHALWLVKSKGGQHWEDIRQKWWMFGGEKDLFDRNIDAGNRKKPLFMNLLPRQYQSPDGGYSHAAGPNIGAIVASTAAALGVVAGVLTSIPEPTASTKAAAIWVGSGAGFLGAISPMLKDFSKDNGATTQQVNDIPTPPPVNPNNPPLKVPDVAPNPISPVKAKGEIPDWAWYVGGAIAVLGTAAAVVLIVRHNKGIKKGK